jgi:hypothetical protein
MEEFSDALIICFVLQQKDCVCMYIYIYMLNFHDSLSQTISLHPYLVACINNSHDHIMRCTASENQHIV